jgi:uncharacterized protein YcfL
MSRKKRIMAVAGVLLLLSGCGSKPQSQVRPSQPIVARERPTEVKIVSDWNDSSPTGESRGFRVVEINGSTKCVHYRDGWGAESISCFPAT